VIHPAKHEGVGAKREVACTRTPEQNKQTVSMFAREVFGRKNPDWVPPGSLAGVPPWRRGQDAKPAV
jgi:hypothetical protein